MLTPPTNPPSLLRDDVERVAELARIPTTEREQFCDYVCDTIEIVRKLDWRAVSSKPENALIKAAEAARALNEAVCSLEKGDREWVNTIADSHPSLSQERRIRGTTEQFEINELNQTVWLLALLFNFATNKSSPIIPGEVQIPGRRSKKSGIGKDMMFEFLLTRILTATAEAGGKLSFNKNDGKGTLVKALKILKSHLPEGVIPKGLSRWPIQEIKTKHAKSRRRLLDNAPSLDKK
jgi:hypothetical protein